MNRITSLADAAGSPRRAGGHHVGDWIERLARAGLAAKGIVYLIVGILAAGAAIGRGAATGSSGALRSIQHQWWGSALLGAVAVGLAGYAVWRFVAAAFDPEHDGVAKRIAAAFTGLLHAALAVQAARLALRGSAGTTGNEESAAGWTAELMSQPFGPWLVGAVGAALGGYGVYQIYKAWIVDLDDQLALVRLSRMAHRWIVRFGRAGLAARGVVFGIIGWFLIDAAAKTDPSQARGVGGALRALQDQPYGPYLLATVAAGLIAYGVFQFVRARYRVIRVPG